MDKSWFPTVSEIFYPEPVSWVENECVWSKMTVFRWLEVLEGTFIRTYMRQSCLGCIVEVFCVVGMQEMRIPTLKCRFNVFVGWERVRTQGQKGSFFRCLEVLETFIRTYIRQSCLGCTVEGFV